MKATRRRYNATNKEKIAAAKKRWYAANREDCLDKGYWAFKDNQESKQKLQRDRYLAQKEKINEKRRDSYNKNHAYRTCRNVERLERYWNARYNHAKFQFDNGVRIRYGDLPLPRKKR